MKLLDNAKPFFSSLILLIALNLIIKPVWVFGIDRQVQNITGLEAYGNYFALLNLCLVLQFLLDLGITPYFSKQLSAEPANARLLASQAFSVKFVLSILYTIVIFAVAAITGVMNWNLLTMLILLQVITTFLLLLRANLSSAQQFTQDAWVSVTDKLFVIILAGALLLYPGISGGITINKFVLIQIGGMLLSVALALFFLYRHKKELLFIRFQVADSQILMASLPFALNIFCMTTLFRADGFMIERLIPEGAYHAGVYASAFRLSDAVNMVGFLVAGFLLPYISKNWPNRNQVGFVLRACRYFLLVPAIVIAAGGWFLAGEINQLLYHARAEEATAVIRILLMCLPALALIQIYGTHLTATGEIRNFLRVSAIFALLNILINFFVIPHHGAEGAAWVAFSTQSAFAAAVTYLAVKRTSVRFYRSDIGYYVALLIISVLIFKWLIL
ncbi:MAG TPA: polysaccharide biosynthesis C-terminal domain-containing protein [Chitinophagaceae bacterium]|nr:polysaccharide biosynthesis C-terminal domain-containing protein [Chitinophagaceae bacterium]